MAHVSTAGGLIAALQKKGAALDTLSLWITAEGALALGTYPNAHEAYDFGKEDFSSLSGAHAPVVPISDPPLAGRRTGSYEFRLGQQIVRFVSAKQMLIESLRLVERERPGMLSTLSRYKGRSKRIVARQLVDLYDTPHLRRFSEEVVPGWFVGTNVATDEAIRHIRRAVEAAGLIWDRDASARQVM